MDSRQEASSLRGNILALVFAIIYLSDKSNNSDKKLRIQNISKELNNKWSV